jgi:hypothetical protein
MLLALLIQQKHGPAAALEEHGLDIFHALHATETIKHS